MRLGDGGPLNFDEPGEELRRTIWVTSLRDSAIEELRADATPLRDSARNLHDVEVKLGDGGSASARLPGLGRVALTISAKLPIGGTYKGEVALLHGGKRHTVPLGVRRVRAPLGIEVAGIAPVRVSGRQQAALQVTLQETAGQAVSLHPAIVNLTVQGKAGAYQAKRGDAESGALTLEPIRLAPNEGRTEVLDLPLRDGPGEYSGTLRLGGEGARPIDVPFTVFVKESWYVALAWILLGVLVSFGLREYTTRLRPGLVYQRAGARLLEQLGDEGAMGGRLDDTERGALEALRGQVRSLLANVRAGSGKGAEAVWMPMEAKQELFVRWAALRHQALALETYELRAGLVGKLSGIEQDLLSPDANMEALAASLQALEAMPKELDQTLRPLLIQRVDEMEKELAAAQDAPSSPVVELLKNDVVLRLRESRDLLRADELSEAIAACNKARRAYAALLIEQLGRMLVQPRPPKGFAEEEWSQIASRIQGELEFARQQIAQDVDRAVRGYQGAHSLMLRALVFTLLEEARALKVADPAMTPERQETQERLEKDLEDSLRLVDEGKLAAATRSYEQARQAYEALPELLQRRPEEPVPMRAPGVAVGATALPTPVRFATIREPPTERAASRQLILTDAWVSLAIFVVIGVLGLLILWKDDPTWGGLGPYAAALLWGGGLHQAAFSGLAGLRSLVVREGSAT